MTYSDQLITGRYQARCKSGYIMQSTGKECGRMASRGQLRCSACATAEVIHHPLGIVRTLVILAVMLVVR
jgi:hypothetical protein